jgi:hypothetical protein
MSITATYINTAQFSVTGDHVEDLRIGTRLFLDQGVDGTLITDVAASLYSAGPDTTTITITSSALTANLATMAHGPVFVDSEVEESNLAIHYHTADWDGGFEAFSGFTDTDKVSYLNSLTDFSIDHGNFVFGINTGGDGVEKKSIVGTTNQVIVTHTTNQIAFTLPQDIDTAAIPEFAGMTLTDFNGVLIGITGVVSALAPTGAYQILRQNSANDALEFTDNELATLTDVDINSPQDGDVITYLSGTWVNAASSGGGSGLTAGEVVGLIIALGE